MKLLFKQRFFSWFDSYDIYDETGNTMFVVKVNLHGDIYFAFMMPKAMRWDISRRRF